MDALLDVHTTLKVGTEFPTSEKVISMEIHMVLKVCMVTVSVM
jgi:hypothetical protein